MSSHGTGWQWPPAITRVCLDTALGHREKGGGGNIEVLLFVEPVNIGREIQFEPKALNDDQHASTGTMARKTV